VPLGVEQYGIVHGGRHTSLFEADDEDSGRLGMSARREPGHVKVTVA
jgi:hypothetical protein